MLLSLVFIILILGITALFFVNSKNNAKILALFTAGSVLAVSTQILALFDPNISYFQSIVTYSIGSNFLNLNYSFGFDGISIFFFYLSALLIFSCILFVWNDPLFKQYALNLLVIELFLLIIFSVLDLLLFYVFFEAILIPMFLMIGIWGSRERKIRAVYLFFFYSIVKLYYKKLFGYKNKLYFVLYIFFGFFCNLPYENISKDHTKVVNVCEREIEQV
jgi:NADH:ubiquinone oxidoreductase subunit 4 (subunit M)